ncbi:helix-turn-helix domain-containing protein [Truepera radiovictrix]|uniref:Transcriptional regulator, XRE family n=1 Tax=Truepera radiovictrix (strain DSM 17093 / CIP 108686 / LMG 22925 / RQ-24) TaxID=649638 RepID=D7CUS0_TRURR|nr:helix-turn-helix transcriptional regulator [Truepera radiovictrix]ADI14061.1 transcriptional regulator, XRE family [Truepera radiovictrix DSM 17093]WMT57378.1 helix-turn-helix transcriptional regulator [Truepera radiovictrix]
MTTATVVSAWEAFQAATGGIKRPETEADYETLRELLNDLTNRYNCNVEPYGSLFDLIATYMHDWELAHEPELKNLVATPQEMLAILMREHGVTQYQLDKEGVVNQGTLSRILKGERGISKALAKKLAERFGVKVELFI